jgi:hypothetical protein
MFWGCAVSAKARRRGGSRGGSVLLGFLINPGNANLPFGVLAV